MWKINVRDFSWILDSPTTANVDLKCQLACAQTQPSLDQRQSPAVAQSQQPGVQTFYVEGVSTKLVVIISFASFLIGMLMMGALWFVHVRTGKFTTFARQSSVVFLIESLNKWAYCRDSNTFASVKRSKRLQQIFFIDFLLFRSKTKTAKI